MVFAYGCHWLVRLHLVGSTGITGLQLHLVSITGFTTTFGELMTATVKCQLGNSRWLSPCAFGLCCYNEDDVYDDVSALTTHGVDQRSSLVCLPASWWVPPWSLVCTATFWWADGGCDARSAGQFKTAAFGGLNGYHWFCSYILVSR